MKASLILVALSCTMCWGQAPDDCKPSILNIPEAKYPCVFPDNRTTFRVIAPDAQKVIVRHGQGFDKKSPEGMDSFGAFPFSHRFYESV